VLVRAFIRVPRLPLSNFSILHASSVLRLGQCCDKSNENLVCILGVLYCIETSDTRGYEGGIEACI
jgi:hypothetical protein